MDIETFLKDNDGGSMCIGTFYNKPEYTREFGNLKNYHNCKRKVDEIRNGLHRFNNKEKQEILKSVLLQVGE
jgi:hypothetical protein